jgi:hypothetical protein
MNIGSVPIIMDNLLQDGATEPAVVVTTNSAYMGASPYNVLTNTIVPFIENTYNVSTDRMDRAFAGLSMGASMTTNIINNNPLRFGYYGVYSFRAGINTNTANLDKAYVHIGCGIWDNLNLCATPAQLNALVGKVNFKNTVLAGGHDFIAWPQLFAIFARDYVWQRGAFVNGAPQFATGGESQSVDENRNLTFTVDATDPDGDALAYSASNLPAGATFDPATRQFSWTPGYTQAGEYTVTFTASDGTRSYSLSGTKQVTITVREVTVGEQLTALKAAVAGLSVNGGLKNALTVKLDQASRLLANGSTADAVNLLSSDFIGQVQSLLSEGKLTAAQAAALTLAAQEAMKNIDA